MRSVLLAADVMVLGLTAGAVACSLLAERVVNHVQRYAAPERARLLLRFALAPWLLAWCVVLLPFLPTVLVAEIGIDDWCLSRNASNTLACPMHDSAAPINDLTFLLVGSLVLLTLAYGWRFTQALRQALQFARNTRHSRIAQIEINGFQVDVLPSARPLALSMSLPRPRILVSEAVLSDLPADELRALLAHEQAHLDRRDGYARLLLCITSSLLFPRARQRLRSAWNLAVEQTCDARAARLTDPCTTASALLRYARLVQADVQAASPCAFASAFDEGDIEARVMALIRPLPARPAPSVHVRWILLASLPAAFALHELGEFVLLPLVR